MLEFGEILMLLDAIDVSEEAASLTRFVSSWKA